jgi:chromosome segregation protein
LVLHDGLAIMPRQAAPRGRSRPSPPPTAPPLALHEAVAEKEGTDLVFLKSLTLRGFKSFAEKTVLDFEPGITVIVGPNGSGKSNVVDALAWVMGTHSAKSLRGGSMSDVIFAGAPNRPALGRAAVEFTIDNADGALPLEFSEVTVARAMFASGENSYAINGVDCRLLDVMELLSDTGLGRENHTIVGQGQLDAILNAKPEERRAFIEEAAGILKHRKRKERALRKLTQMEAHLERLSDVLRELRRNLRPLERQAEAARKHAALQAELREIRVLRAVRELDALARRWEDEASVRVAAEQQLAALEATLGQVRGEESTLEEALARLGPDVQRASETHFRLANLVERFRGLSERIEERRHGLNEAVEEPVAGRDPQELRGRADEERAALQELEAERGHALGALEAAKGRRQAAEQARRAHEQAAAAEARRRAQAREQKLRWEGEIAALRSSLAQASSEEGRLDSQLSGLRARRDELGHDVEAVTSEIRRLDSQAPALAGQLEAAGQALDRRQEASDAAARAERESERRRASLDARADALRAASTEASGGSGVLLEAAERGDVDGVIGPLADQVAVVEGMARAAAAALGPLGDALVSSSRTAAAEAIGFVRAGRHGRVLLLADLDDHGGDAAGGSAARDRELADLGARPLAEAFRARPGVLRALQRALAGVYAVGDFDAACDLAARYTGCAFVSVSGDMAGPRGYAGGSATAASAVLSRAAAEQAEAELEIVERELLVAHRRVADADRALGEARRELEAATAAQQESDGLITSAAERLGRLRKELATCERELDALQRQRADLSAELAGQRQRLGALEQRGPEVTGTDADEDAGPDLAAEQLDDALAEAREQEVQARLTASTVDQRLQESVRRIDGLEREADDVERQLAERARRREQRLAAIERCAELAVVAAGALGRAEASLAVSATERDRLEEERAARQGQLGVVRARLRELAAELEGLRERRHSDDLRRAELRHALDAARSRLRDDLELDPDEALQSARAAAGSPEDPLAQGDERDRELAESEDRLVKRIGLLGTVNPLAMEEHAALQQRQEFLTEQMDDLRRSRDDLLDVVEAVDGRIREVFADAFRDVAAQFERMFPRLFPGGEGRLVLTDPDDMLTTGVEVEARPPGKRVKRLSLLSGGERSLTALAVLFAIFAARPSPFYVLDEVEAALDDVNLQRFLDVVGDFRGSSQLLIVTHQKRTMEVADTLYGISMQRDGLSKVISQRMTEAAST